MERREEKKPEVLEATGRDLGHEKAACSPGFQSPCGEAQNGGERTRIRRGGSWWGVMLKKGRKTPP